ncbi:flagellar hook protein FlgE [Methylotenera mobilis]|uniref:Flagellar hook protein FlgE n=1 Tax=Methylotenera mobilis (strain JLW8 / ATCC BAA-1282 / DSM 17540) TaxID=583345 RepID=C6WVA7_METML|nr:flagellar hook protein FlgE [Methylotenera mobilis]ACT47856.1 flagellar basal body FlaE domain protein [Methylotenera mobilis JLW8]
MSFQQGLSGLNAASKQLEVIGNNVSNANTVGFKQSRAEFADVFANSITGGGGSQIGIGTNLATVAQQFTQGNITATNNSLDIAINGNGFFRMSSGGAVTYTRNGQFQLDKQGFIVDSASKRLTGYAADANGNILSGAAVDLQINTADIQPVATTKIEGTINLDSRNNPMPAAPVFSSTDPTTYNNSTAVTVYDSLGNSHTLQNFFRKTAANVWDIYTTVDGAPIPASGAATAQMTFTGTGVSPTITPTAPATGIPSVTFTPMNTATTPVANGAANVTTTIDYSKSTQFGSAFSINALSQDGFTSGRLSGFNTASDGTIVGRYSNGQSKNLGRVVLSSFTNPNGLQSLGGNAWAVSASSGPALTGAPGSGLLGVLQSSAVEDSNVDLTAELVNMITAQRVYQANAQTIKTQDQVLQTLVNLR